MYKITNATTRASVRAAYAARTRRIVNRITFGHYTMSAGVRSFVSDNIVITEGLKSLTVSQAFGGGDDVTIGGVGSSSYSATFTNPSATFNYQDKIAFVESGILRDNGSYYYTPCGYFTTDKPETDDDGKTLTVTGYDDIDKMGGKWKPTTTVTDTTSLKDVIEGIARAHGLSVVYIDTTAQNALKNHAIGVANAAGLTEQGERDVLGYCAGCAGMSVRINTVGKLSVSWYFSPGTTYDYTVLADSQHESGFNKTTAVKVQAITSGVDEDVYTKGTGVPISFANPLITHAEIDAIYARYNNRAWHPATCLWRGDPCIEAGDIITVKDKNNKAYTVYVAQQELDMTGGLSSTITSPTLDTSGISFDTVSSAVRFELSKVKNSMEEAIKAATDAINGANGGYYRILDVDKDGNPDGWECYATDGLRGVKCTYGGIGCTTDGGKTFTNAMTGGGINATAITTGIITGGTNGFSFNLNTGHISASDIAITGGDINLDGGSLSIVNPDGYKTDLSSGTLKIYQGFGQNQATPNEEIFSISTSVVYDYPTGSVYNPSVYWYTNIATPKFSGGGADSVGIRFGRSESNARLTANKPADAGSAALPDWIWDTDYALFEPDRCRFRRQIVTNEAGYNVFAGFLHHRTFLDNGDDYTVGLGIGSAKTGAVELTNQTTGKVIARMDIYPSGTNGEGVSLKISGQSYNGRIFVDTSGMYAQFGTGTPVKLA